MIVITRTKNEITVKGHARCANPGNDIVCAAISTLLQTLIVSILEMTTDEIEHNISCDDTGKPDRKSVNGNVVIKHGDLSEKAKTLVDSFFIGCLGVANAHPRYVTVMEIPN